MDRFNFFYLMLVTEGHLDAAFDKAEQADRDLAAELGFVGVVSGLEVSERTVPALSVDVGDGVAYDQAGQRIELVTDSAVVLSADSDDVSTEVLGPGNEKWLSIFFKFERDLADPQPDGNGDIVYFERDEYFRFVVVQGSEAPEGTASKPALISDGILLADVRRTQGVTAILDAEIYTDRRQNAFELSAGSLVVRAGTPGASDQAILDHLNDHVTDGSGAHAASAVSYAGGPAWADGTTNPATTAEAQLDKVVSDLASTTSSSSGGRKVGVESLVGVSSTISAGTLFAVLTALKSAANLDVAARSAWLGGRTNPAATAQAALEKIVVDLGLATSSDDGAERIGAQATASTPNSLASGSVRSQLDELLGFVNALEATIADRVAVAWGRFSTNGSGSVLTVDQEGIASATCNASRILITFSTPFANTNFAPMVTSLDGTTHRQYKVNASSLTTTEMEIYVVDPINDLTVDPSANLCSFAIDVKGRLP